MKQEFIKTTNHITVPAPILLKFSIKGIDVYLNKNTKGTVANFFRRLGKRDDDGYPEGNHIGYIQYKDINELYQLFKAKYPEELL